MRDIPASAVTAAVKALCVPANNQLPPDVEAAVRGAYESEPWPIAKQTLGTLCQNLDAARATGLPHLPGYGNGLCICRNRPGCAYHRRFL